MSAIQKVIDILDIAEFAPIGFGAQILKQNAAAELAYLQACAAAIEDLSRMEATDATIAMFFKRDAKKLAKMKARTK